MKIINTLNAPQAIGPYSQAILKDNFLFASGQIPIDPKTQQIISNDIVKQTQQVLNNMLAIVKEANLNITDIVKTTIFLTDLNNFGAVNKTYEDFFKTHKPARSTVEVSRLPKDVLIEIEFIAIK